MKTSKNIIDRLDYFETVDLSDCGEIKVTLDYDHMITLEFNESLEITGAVGNVPETDNEVNFLNSHLKEVNQKFGKYAILDVRY